MGGGKKAFTSKNNSGAKLGGQETGWEEENPRHRQTKWPALLFLAPGVAPP